MQILKQACSIDRPRSHGAVLTVRDMFKKKKDMFLFYTKNINRTQEYLILVP